MAIQLSDHFSYQKLLRFTIPSIGMMLFVSVYGVVDGLFVSNFVGKTAFASVNLIMPFLQILSGVGAMLGVGGSALVAKTLGEGDDRRAGRYFSMTLMLLMAVGLLFTVVGVVFMRPVAYLLGATDGMIGDCVAYGRTVMLFSLFMHMQYTFQSYLIVAERPTLGLIVTVAAGLTNMLLALLFVGILGGGVVGAGLATGLSQCVGGLVPFLWFLSRRNRSALRFAPTKMEWRPILKACGNGASEMLGSVSGSITGMFYNHQLMAHAGEDGVAAYGALMYAGFVFVAVFLGYATGVAPVVGYHFGAGDHRELRSLLRKSLTVVLAAGLLMALLALALAMPMARLFVGYDDELMAMTVRAFRISAGAFLVMGVGIFTSSFFTALNDGLVSMEISALRTLVFPLASVLVMPALLGLDGVWVSLAVSEGMSLATAAGFLLAKRKKYRYGRIAEPLS